MSDKNSTSAPVQASEVPVMKKLSTALACAAAVERAPYNGMYISLTGVLSHAARSLRELSKPPETNDKRLLEEHEDLCYAVQPQMHAHNLESLSKHLVLVKTAIERGDMATIRQFFEIYRFD